MRSQLLKSVPWLLPGTFVLKVLTTGFITKDYLVDKVRNLKETLGV
jgi:hypothetical protein